MTLTAAGYELGQRLPGIYHDDDLVQLLCEAIDDMLAPVVSAVDSFSAYLDPLTTSDDFLVWLAGWVGLELDGANRPVDRRRMVGEAVRLHQLRGTSEGIRAAVEMWFGVSPEIRESGGMGWSPDPDTPMPGVSAPLVSVTIRVEDPSTIDVNDVDRVVRALKPAHVPHELVVVAP